MATRISDNLTVIRARLREFSPRAWTDQELLDIYNRGCKDLWRAINELHKNHFVTVDETNCALLANTGSISGLPEDVYKIVQIEPETVGEGSSTPGLIFKPASGLNDPRFVTARAQGAVSPQQVIIYYVTINEGAPVGPPTVLVAPRVSVAVNLRVIYNHTITTVDEDDNNPIPGESDNAVEAWTIAYARGDEREDRAPDPEWLAIYATEKANLLKQITPRQTQEPDVVEGMFEEDWQ